MKRGDIEAGCSEARTHLDVQSDDAPDAVAEVVQLAHRGCFLEQMIEKPVPVRSTLTLNGSVIHGDRA